MCYVVLVLFGRRRRAWENLEVGGVCESDVGSVGSVVGCVLFV